MERDAFLARVANAALASQLPPDPGAPALLPQLEETDLVHLFRERAQSVNTVVHGPMTRHSVPRTVVGIAAGHGAGSFVAWDDLPTPGVAAALMADGLGRIGTVDEDEGVDVAQLVAQADLGVTGAAAALAESGSVVLSHAAGRGRLASLLPPVHVAIVDVKNIVRTLAYWAVDEPDAPGKTSNLVIVTGPSRTGDIELHLNLGVHGPKHVHVVMVK